MASFERLQAATERHASQRDGIILQLLKMLLGLWSGFDRWDDADVVAGMAARSAMLVDSATARGRLLNRSYLSSVFREMGETLPALPPVVNGYPRANTNASEVYRRPVEEFIWRRRNGSTLAESKDAFEERLRAIAEADARAAERDEGDLVMGHAKTAIGFRRIIHPELSKTGTCGLCIVASQRFYKIGELLPLHGKTCHCDVLPITSADDPGFRLNDDDLKKVYAAAGSTAAEDLQNTRVQTVMHGELGPILVKKGDHFRTAEEAGRPPYVKATPATIRRDREAERTLLTSDLDRARTRYEAESAAMPDEVRIPLFRSLKYMQERISSIDTFLANLAE